MATDKQPRVLYVDRTKHVLDARVQSRSDEETEYTVTLLLSATMLCSCPGNRMRDSKCVHIKRALEMLDADELREFVLDAQEVPR